MPKITLEQKERYTETRKKLDSHIRGLKDYPKCKRCHKILRAIPEECLSCSKFHGTISKINPKYCMECVRTEEDYKALRNKINGKSRQK